MNTDLFRKLVAAHFNGDEELFRSLLIEIIKEERGKRQTVFAKELEGLIKTNLGETMQKDLSKWRRSSPIDLPKDREKGFPLVEIKEPDKRLDQLLLSKQIRSQFDRAILEQRKADTLRSHGLEPVKKLLFFGPPGCGKTALAQALAAELYLPFVLVRFDSLISSFLGETAGNLKRIFDFIQNTPCVALFDEFDAIGKSRDSEDEHGEIKRLINSFLQIADGFKGESIIIAATNHQQLLDSALWRRFDMIFEFKLPTPSEINDLLLKFINKFDIDRNINLSSIATKVNGYSHADVERMILDSIKYSILNGEDKISKESINSAIASLLSRFRPDSFGDPKRKDARKKK